MKVVLKPSIIDEIYKRIRDAEMGHRKVDYILVTPEEFDEIRYQARPNLSPVAMDYRNPFAEVSFKTVTLTDRTDPCGPKRTFASHNTLFGYPLYVVPNHFN